MGGGSSPPPPPPPPPPSPSLPGGGRSGDQRPFSLGLTDAPKGGREGGREEGREGTVFEEIRKQKTIDIYICE